MSYEGEMLKQFKMPPKQKVEHALLRALLERGGSIKEFASGQEIVTEIAKDTFNAGPVETVVASATVGTAVVVAIGFIFTGVVSGFATCPYCKKMNQAGHIPSLLMRDL